MVLPCFIDDPKAHIRTEYHEKEVVQLHTQPKETKRMAAVRATGGDGGASGEAGESARIGRTTAYRQAGRKKKTVSRIELCT